jgi:hypothetical protein
MRPFFSNTVLIQSLKNRFQWSKFCDAVGHLRKRKYLVEIDEMVSLMPVGRNNRAGGALWQLLMLR